MNLIEQLRQIPLSHNQTVYMMVDGTQLKELAKSLYQIQGQLTLEPIYLYEPHNTLISVSPYLVVATNNVIRWFAEQNNPLLGYFFTSGLNFDDLADGFRHFIKVQTPYDSSAYFKFANSESAYVLLSTNSLQFWSLFKEVWLPTRHGFYHMQQPERLDIGLTSSVIKLSDEQWERLGDIVWRNTLDKITLHIKTWFPHLEINFKEKDNWLENWATYAYKNGFTSEKDLLMFFNVIGFTSEISISDPKFHPEIYALVNNISDLTPSQRIEKAALISEKYNESQKEVTN